MYPVVLNGERVVLRELRRQDLRAVFTYAKDEETMRFMTWPSPLVPEDSLPFLESCLSDAVTQPRTKYEFGIQVEEGLVGSCGLRIDPEAGYRADMGYALRRDMWNQGLMTEAAGMLIDFGFDQLGLHRIQAFHDPNNIGSKRVMEKLGMKYEGRLRAHMRARNGQWRESDLRSIITDDKNSIGRNAENL